MIGTRPAGLARFRADERIAAQRDHPPGHLSRQWNVARRDSLVAHDTCLAEGDADRRQSADALVESVNAWRAGSGEDVRAGSAPRPAHQRAIAHVWIDNCKWDDLHSVHAGVGALLTTLGGRGGLPRTGRVRAMPGRGGSVGVSETPVIRLRSSPHMPPVTSPRSVSWQRAFAMALVTPDGYVQPRPTPGPRTSRAGPEPNKIAAQLAAEFRELLPSPSSVLCPTGRFHQTDTFA